MNIIKIKKKFSQQNRIQEIINKKNRIKQLEFAKKYIDKNISF